MEKSLKTMNKCLCKALEVNYTCLRIASQEQEPEESLIKTGSDIFRKPKSLKQVWLTQKLRDVANERNQFFNYTISKINETANVSQPTINFEESKKYLIDAYNKFYGTNKSFEECFDGFEILDEDFKKAFELFDSKAIVNISEMSQVIGAAYLFHLYQTYLTFLVDQVKFKSFSDIINTLNNDLNSSGYKSMFFRKPANENVSFLTKDKLDEMIHSIFDECIKATKKHAEISKEIAKKQKEYKRTLNSDCIVDIGELNIKGHEQKIRADKLRGIASVLEEFDNRMKSTNSDYYSDISTKIVEGVFDLTSGIDPFDKSKNPTFGSTYIHSLEKEFLTYLFKSVGLENPFSKRKSLHNPENEKQ